MVGDGINDSPGAGPIRRGDHPRCRYDVALESAGVVLVSDKLNKVVSALLLGRASHRKMQQNIAVAQLTNVVGITLATFDLISPHRSPLAL